MKPGPAFQFDLDERFPHLANAPIVEAVVQWVVRAEKPLESDDLWRQFAERLPDYPECRPQRMFMVQAQFELDGSSRQLQQDTWVGFRLSSADKLHVVQVSRDGLAFSRLRQYGNWDRFCSAAIRAAGPGDDHAEGLTVDLSQIDFEKLRKEFAKAKHKNTATKDIRDVVEEKLRQMVNSNPMRMDYYRRYQEIVADYNREKDRATVEQTFAALVKLAGELDDEQLRAVHEGLSEGELALFDLLRRDGLKKTELERLKQASKTLLGRVRELLAPVEHWTRNAQTQAEVKASILDWLYESLPRPPFTESETDSLADRVYGYVWQRSQAGTLL